MTLAMFMKILSKVRTIKKERRIEKAIAGRTKRCAECVCGLVLLVCTWGRVLAQGSFNFGLVGGGILGWARTPEPTISTKGVRPGFFYGLRVEYLLGENYGFATGLQMSYYGGLALYDTSFIVKYRGGMDTASGGTQLDYWINYLELPVLLHFQTTEIGYVRYFGQFGFIGGMRLSAKAQSDALEPLKKRTTIEDITLFNLGLMVGLGMRYSLAENAALHVSVFYNNGFLDITRHQKYPDPNPDRRKQEDDNGKVALNSVRLSIGIMF